MDGPFLCYVVCSLVHLLLDRPDMMLDFSPLPALLVSPIHASKLPTHELLQRFNHVSMDGLCEPRVTLPFFPRTVPYAVQYIHPPALSYLVLFSPFRIRLRHRDEQMGLLD
jgi:hypothetical protein